MRNFLYGFTAGLVLPVLFVMVVIVHDLRYVPAAFLLYAVKFIAPTRCGHWWPWHR